MKLDNMNLEPIIVKAIDKIEGLGWDLEFAINISEEYKKFLELCSSNPDLPIVPSKYVDEFWHLHILDTQKYYQDCEEYLGYFLHHFPYFGMRGKDDETNLLNAWEGTLKLYENHYGIKPDEKLWEGSNRCPNCGKRCSNKEGVFEEERPTLAAYQNIN